LWDLIYVDFTTAADEQLPFWRYHRQASKTGMQGEGHTGLPKNCYGENLVPCQTSFFDFIPLRLMQKSFAWDNTFMFDGY